jgi:type IV pilus assembly protein PilE
VPAGLDALTSYATRQEQAYQDGGNYGVGNCVASLPAAENFTVDCALGINGQSFTATATGSGMLSGYAYSIDNLGVRRTVAHPNGVPANNCWSMKGGSCDT